ncbi:hypothetical protein HDV02_002673 [Globomyces sp. JEL0801]|nr:hypothetical protein HDV02_002673 [Globomyces sp. JEL0801]
MSTDQLVSKNNMTITMTKNQAMFMIQILILKQQAAKTTKEYLKLLDKEQKEKEGNVKSKVEVSNSSASTEVEKLKKELEIVKKQASQTNDEYMKLTDKYVALEKKLSGSKENKKDV